MNDEITYKEVEELAKSADIYGVLPGASYIFVFSKRDISFALVRHFTKKLSRLLAGSRYCVLVCHNKDALRILKLNE